MAALDTASKFDLATEESKMRVICTSQLLRLAEASEQAGFNRRVDPDQLRHALDPEGQHVIAHVLNHHHIAGQEVPLHYRCQVWAKIPGSVQPTRFMLDVAPEDFRPLPSA